VLQRLAAMHRAELQSLQGIFAVPDLPAPGANA
jgi:hypothetical protein